MRTGEIVASRWTRWATLLFGGTALLSAVEVGGVCDATVFLPQEMLNRRNCEAELTRLAAATPSRCLLARFTGVGSEDARDRYVDPPNVYEAPPEFIWKAYRAIWFQPRVPLCQLERFGSAQAFRWIDGDGSYGSEGRELLDRRLFGPGSGIRFLHISFGGTLGKIYVRLFLVSTEALSVVAASAVSEKLVKALRLGETEAYVILARHPWFFEPPFPNANPWFSPSFVGFDAARKNPTINCIVRKGRARCLGKLAQ